MNWVIGLIVSIFSIYGITGLYIYLCKYYTILRVKDMENILSNLTDVTDNERDLLKSIRQFLENPEYVKID